MKVAFRFSQLSQLNPSIQSIKHWSKLAVVVVASTLVAPTLHAGADDYQVASNGLLRLPASAETLTVQRVHVASGGQLMVPASVMVLSVGELVLEKGARLFIAPRDSLFELKLGYAQFSDGSVISARGVDGGVGVPGGKGTDLRVSARKVQLDNLRIDVRGGNGGAGWNGVPGENGRKAACWGRTSNDGTAGGNGGDGLAGGAGGNVELKLGNNRWIEFIDVMQSGGQAGAFGKGALGGAEGDAANCWLYTVNASEQGQDGVDGKAGQAGARGTLLIR